MAIKITITIEETKEEKEVQAIGFVPPDAVLKPEEDKCKPKPLKIEPN